jgi:tungstate transport system ATP-binding protein
MTGGGSNDGGALLEARDLVVRADGRELVRVETITVEQGRTRVLLGPNGAGKTSLLRALNGLVASEGDLVFDGRPVRSDRDRLRLRRRTAAVFQNAFLLATTVRGNVESGLRIRGLHGDARHARADEALEMLGIAHLADRGRAGLSGGEAQRVSIARAIAVDPVILFLDEPMASLDPPTRRSLVADLRRIFRELSVAVLWVTHDIDEALEIGDDVTFLSAGRVVQDGLVTDVLNRPADEVVSEFMGVDVWLEGTVVPDPAGGATFALGDGAVLRCAETDAGTAFACLHPEDVVVSTSPPELPGPAGARNVLEATVTDLKEVRRLRLVGLEWQGHRLESLVTRAVFEELDVTVGQRVWAMVAAAAVRPVTRAEGSG